MFMMVSQAQGVGTGHILLCLAADSGGSTNSTMAAGKKRVKLKSHWAQECQGNIQARECLLFSPYLDFSYQ